MNRTSLAVLVVILCALAAAPARAQKPDAELKGITLVGVVVENLNAQAAACGLRQDAIERAATKILTDSGFRVIRGADTDTYLSLSVMTTNAGPGLCVSRYDAYFYAHVTTSLSYQATPVPVQVSLIHEGGLAGGGAAGHGDNVVKSLSAYIEQIASRIHAANQQN